MKRDRDNQDRVRPGFDRRMTGEEINLCPIRRWQGAIHVIRSQDELSRAAEKLGRETVLGFDTETRPAFKKGQQYPPSLLQLAGEKRVYLFQLQHCGLQEPLISILSSPHVVKAGVSLVYDLQELQKLQPFDHKGFVGLGGLSRKMGIKNHGLRGLAAVVLGLRISKSARTTNWARDELTPAQQRYAATDAWVGRELYLKMAQMRSVND